MPRDSKNFRVFMAKETYWSQLIEKATWITSDLCAKDGISLSEGHVYYFTRMRDLHFNKDFSTLLPKVKSANPPEKQPEFSCTARRLVFSPVWAEIGVTPEEISLCPWWLEYPQGECHPSELHLFTNKGNVQASKTVAIEAPKFFEVGSTSNPKIKKGVVRKRAKTKRQLDLDATTETSSTQSGGGPHGTSIFLPWFHCFDCFNYTFFYVGIECTILLHTNLFCSTKSIGYMLYESKHIEDGLQEELQCLEGLGGILYLHEPTLIFAQLPTSLGVKLLNDEVGVPSWNEFSIEIVEATFCIASRHLSTDGWLAILCTPDLFPDIDRAATIFDFTRGPVLSVLNEVGYKRNDSVEEVTLLTMPLYHRASSHPTTYGRKSGYRVNKNVFCPKRNWVMDLNNLTITKVVGEPCRGG